MAVILRPRVAEKMMDTTTRPENWKSDTTKEGCAQWNKGENSLYVELVEFVLIKIGV